jgi:hypothetical protein
MPHSMRSRVVTNIGVLVREANGVSLASHVHSPLHPLLLLAPCDRLHRQATSISSRILAPFLFQIHPFCPHVLHPLPSH